MRLKKVWIQEYKNLKDFTVEFDGNNFVDIFVGKNGSGKSNFFEALLEIFHHLKFFKKVLNFSYRVEFEQDSATSDYEFNSATRSLKLNGKKAPKIESRPLPDHVLIYYSGHNKQIPHFIDEYEKKFDNKIKKMQELASPFFISLTDAYKKLFLTLILFNNKTKDKDFLFKKLGLVGVDTTLEVKLKRPHFADSRLEELGYDQIDLADAQTEFWGATGVVQKFLNDLKLCIKREYSPGDIYDRSNDSYELPIGQELYISSYSSEDIFSQVQYFDLLYRVGMLDKITLKLTLKNGDIGDLKQFSDGQLQAAYIYALTEIYSHKNCLVLLDEPDTYLHPEWQFEFLKQIIAIDSATQSHILLSSHSPATLTQVEQSKILTFNLKSNNAHNYLTPKHVAVKKLCGDLLHYSEQSGLLSIIQTIQFSSKPLLFCEGVTEPIILREAWDRLYEEEMPFIPYYAFSCTYLRQFILDKKIYDDLKNTPVFALFDFDKAYSQWNSLNGSDTETDPYNGLSKKLKDYNAFALMLPVPPNEKIRKQVIKDNAEKTTFGEEACLYIEHLFYGIEITNGYFKEELKPGGGKIIIFNGDKVNFARNIVPTLPKECFEPFRPMFEFIKSKINDTLNNATITP